MNRHLPLLILMGISSVFAQEGDTSADEAPVTGTDAPVVFCLVVHSPGPAWKGGVPFQEQPGIEAHIRYMRRQLDGGLMVSGGPFLDNSGGMLILRTSDVQKARSIATSDPAVISGLLTVEVKQWMVPMSSVDYSSK